MRETKELTTPHGHKVVIYTHITARGQREVQSLFMRHLQINKIPEQGAKELSDIGQLEGVTGEIMMQAQDIALKHMVVSVDGNTTAPDSLVLDLPPDDANFVFAEIDKLTADEKKGSPEPQNSTSPATS
jgi:hypothetical protein